MQVNFTPDLIWYNFLQYDSVSGTLGYNGRLAWEFRPGMKAFLVVNWNASRDNSRLALLQLETALKIGVTIRF